MKSFLSIIGIFALALIAGDVFAQVVAPAAPTYLDGVISWLQSNVTLMAGVVGVAEVLLRLIPSANALSILVPVKYIFSGAATILSFLAVNVLQPLIDNGQNAAASAQLKK